MSPSIAFLLMGAHARYRYLRDASNQRHPFRMLAAGQMNRHLERFHVENVDVIDVRNVNVRPVWRKQDFLVCRRAKSPA
jgi:hypothetical protein